MTYQVKAAQYKKDAVKTLSKYMQEYPVVGILNVENLPARQLQVLRAKLRKDVLITMSKKLFINRAIEFVKGSKKNFEKLSESVTGMPALLFTKQNPFKVSALIMASKSKAPAKPGQVAPFDLIIPAGPTQFTPGPIISELGAVGLKTGVENGKISIKEASVIVKQGEVISDKASDILAKFNIEPMEIGLDLVAAYEDGFIYGRDVLSVSPAEYLSMIKTAASESLGLSIEIAYPTKENIERLIGVVFNTAKNFALDKNLPSDVVTEKQLGEASRAAESIADAAGVQSVAETPKEEPAPAAETPKEEIKKQEPEKKAEPVAEVKKEEPEKVETAPEVKPEPKPEVKVEEKKEEVKKEDPVPAAEEPKKEEKKEEAVEEKKEPDLSQAEKLSKDFQKEITAEKERRDSIDTLETEKLAKQLKKKGTFREPAKE